MAATKGNQWWKLRSKHGKDKIFTNPKILLEACYEYFEATDRRKWIKKDWVGKDSMEVIRETETPYTITGLCLFLGIGLQTLHNYKKNKDYLEVITHVEDIIYTQKFEGATVGAFNPNIIARDLGLADKSEIKNKHSFEDMSDEELDKEIEKLS
jgi:hypothetical protein